MPQMSKAEVGYYLDRMTPLRNPHQISKSLGVTYQTALRWIEGQTLPSEKMRVRFEEAFDLLIDELDAQSDVGKLIANALTRDPPPKAKRALVVKANRNILQEIIKRMLAGNKSVRSTQIFKEASTHGFSKISVHMMANKMGVIKNQKGLGRNSYSLWRLP